MHKWSERDCFIRVYLSACWMLKFFYIFQLFLIITHKIIILYITTLMYHTSCWVIIELQPKYYVYVLYVLYVAEARIGDTLEIAVIVGKKNWVYMWHAVHRLSFKTFICIPVRLAGVTPQIATCTLSALMVAATSSINSRLLINMIVNSCNPMW